VKKIHIEQKADKFRKLLGIDDEMIHEETLLKLLEKQNYYIFYEELGREATSGAAFRRKDLNFIIINSSQTLGRQNFTLAHELGHIILHEKDIFDLKIENKKLETQADTFAACFLMPEKQIIFHLNSKKKINKFDILLISQNFRVSFLAAAIRLKTIYGASKMPENFKNLKINQIISDYKSNHLDQQAMSIAESIDFDNGLYKPTNKAYYPGKKMLKKMIISFKNNKISYSKFLEFINFLGLDIKKILPIIK